MDDRQGQVRCRWATGRKGETGGRRESIDMVQGAMERYRGNMGGLIDKWEKKKKEEEEDSWRNAKTKGKSK